MRSRVGWVVLGIVITMVGLVGGAYLLVTAGAVSLDTTAPPLPFERMLARLALYASIGQAAEQPDPLPVTDANLLAGVQVYHDHCVGCHGTPGQPRTAIATGMFPPPPQLFATGDMVTDDPEGVIYWKVTHGIRLSGMPGFARTLSEMERWQVTMLVAHADQLSPAVQAALRP